MAVMVYAVVWATITILALVALALALVLVLGALCFGAAFVLWWLGLDATWSAILGPMLTMWLGLTVAIARARGSAR